MKRFSLVLFVACGGDNTLPPDGGGGDASIDNVGPDVVETTDVIGQQPTLAQYDAAANIAPESPAGPLEGGMRTARWGEVEQAKPRLEEAIRRGARDAETYHALGVVRLHLKDVDGAEQAYREGLRVDPKHDENLIGLATVAIMRDDAKGALAAYDALVAKHPNYAAGHLGRAWALAKLGKKDDARAAIDRAESLGAPKANVDRQRASLGQ